MTIDVEEGEDPEAAYAAAKEYVDLKLGRGSEKQPPNGALVDPPYSKEIYADWKAVDRAIEVDAADYQVRSYGKTNRDVKRKDAYVVSKKVAGRMANLDLEDADPPPPAPAAADGAQQDAQERNEILTKLRNAGVRRRF